MNQKQLHMQPVSSRYLSSTMLCCYVFQVSTRNSAPWAGRRRIHPRQVPTMEKADVIGWFDRDTLVSQVAVYPCRRAFLAEPTPWAA
ncbi:MAG: GNAT family N-acetyltransferase [Evtepia gabavorous]